MQLIPDNITRNTNFLDAKYKEIKRYLSELLKHTQPANNKSHVTQSLSRKHMKSMLEACENPISPEQISLHGKIKKTLTEQTQAQRRATAQASQYKWPFVFITVILYVYCYMPFVKDVKRSARLSLISRRSNDEPTKLRFDIFSSYYKPTALNELSDHVSKYGFDSLETISHVGSDSDLPIDITSAQLLFREEFLIDVFLRDDTQKQLEKILSRYFEAEESTSTLSKHLYLDLAKRLVDESKEHLSYGTLSTREIAQHSRQIMDLMSLIVPKNVSHWYVPVENQQEKRNWYLEKLTIGILISIIYTVKYHIPNANRKIREAQAPLQHYNALYLFLFNLNETIQHLLKNNDLSLKEIDNLMLDVDADDQTIHVIYDLLSHCFSNFPKSAEEDEFYDFKNLVSVLNRTLDDAIKSFTLPKTQLKNSDTGSHKITQTIQREDSTKRLKRRQKKPVDLVKVQQTDQQLSVLEKDILNVGLANKENQLNIIESKSGKIITYSFDEVELKNNGFVSSVRLTRKIMQEIQSKQCVDDLIKSIENLMIRKSIPSNKISIRGIVRYSKDNTCCYKIKLSSKGYASDYRIWTNWHVPTYTYKNGLYRPEIDLLFQNSGNHKEFKKFFNSK